MCLAVPGRIIEIEEPAIGTSAADENRALLSAKIGRTGRVSFGGLVKTVNLAYTPEAQVGDYVVVHVGFALHTVDEQEAERVFDYLGEQGELDELGQPRAEP